MVFLPFPKPPVHGFPMTQLCTLDTEIERERERMYDITRHDMKTIHMTSRKKMDGYGIVCKSEED